MSSSSTAARAAILQYSSRGSSSSSSVSSENLPPRTLARLAREVRDLHKNPPEGVRLVVDTDSGLPSNLSELMAELSGPQGTPYEGKFFLIKLVFSSDFPAGPPRGFFLTKIYHPNVDMSTNGAICVNTLKRDWTPETSLSHVLAVIRCLLIVPFPESSLNDEAGKLFMDSYEEYAKRARLMADVHGRSVSAVDDVPLGGKSNIVQGGNSSNGDSSTSGNSNSNQLGGPLSKSSSNNTDTTRVLKSSSDNPLRSNNTKTTAAPAKKANKKKSLKRL